MASFADTLDKQTTAIVFIEYQHEFTTEGGKLHPAVKPCMEHCNTLKNSVELLQIAREKGIKVIHAPITFSDDYRELRGSLNFGILANVKAGHCFLKSAWGGEICAEMKPLAHEIIVQGKNGLCAFASTNLDFILRQNSINTICLCGYLTNCCVESTMRTAYEKGYNVITVTDCTAATSVEEHTAACSYTFPMFSLPLSLAQLTEKL